MTDHAFFQPYTEFAFISLAVAVGYLGAAWLTRQVVHLFERYRRPKATITRPGEMVHQAMKVSGRLWDYFRTAVLLFCISFLLLVNFGRYDLLPPNSNVINMVLFGVLMAVLGFAALKIIQLARYRMRLTNLLDMHNQMARRLVEVQLRGSRVFPSVDVEHQVIDNVVVGSNGIYAAQLIVSPPGAVSVKYERGAMLFQPCGTRISIAKFTQAYRDLSSVLQREVGTQVPLLPVVVIPECRIDSGEGNGPMVVSLQACASFTSWQDKEFFMHNEDLAKISVWLGKQYMAEPPRTMQAVVTSLEMHINWPVLLGRAPITGPSV
jgi:hypothetical protein